MCIFSGFQYGILNKVHGEIQIRQGLVQKFVVVRPVFEAKRDSGSEKCLSNNKEKELWSGESG